MKFTSLYCIVALLVSQSFAARKNNRAGRNRNGRKNVDTYTTITRTITRYISSRTNNAPLALRPTPVQNFGNT
ncbi:hypothetical protein AYI69_g5070, partial [Smittium culicis]